MSHQLRNFNTTSTSTQISNWNNSFWKIRKIYDFKKINMDHISFYVLDAIGKNEMHELASVLLHKIIGSPLPSPTEEKLISQLLVNLEQTSNISTDQKIFVRVSELINRDSGWKNIHWWEIEQRGTVFEIRGGDDLYQFSTGQDSFTIGHWEAQPADVTLHNSTNTMWYMKPDMEEFCAAVNSMDLSLPGYQLEVTE